MFFKLILIIVAAGAIAGSLLVIRQQKVETIHDISRAYTAARQRQQMMWNLELEITRRTHPQVLRKQMDAMGIDWHQIPAAPADKWKSSLHVVTSDDVEPSEWGG